MFSATSEFLAVKPILCLKGKILLYKVKWIYIKVNYSENIYSRDEYVILPHMLVFLISKQKM